MREDEIKSPIFVKADEKGASTEEKIRRGQALGSVIVKYFENSGYDNNILELYYLAGSFVHNKVLSAIEFATSLLKAKGLVPVFTISQFDDRKYSIVITLGKMEDTDDFKKAIQRAIKAA